jgi:hypothetical protein
VEEHVAFSIEQHLYRPLAKTSAGFPQVHASRLSVGEILRELLREPF